MSWERDPLWAKSKLFFEYAFDNPREDPRFGLWCAMALELLARAAVASVSSTLLAEPDSSHKYLLQALNIGVDKGPRKSVAMNQVLSLCKVLVNNFTDEEYSAAIALTNRRNDEVHTGACAFLEYTTQQWIAGCYKCCLILTAHLNESLETLFGPEEAKVAFDVLSQKENDVKQAVLSQIAAHKKVFESLTQDKKDSLVETERDRGEKLAYLRYHRVACPACKGPATVHGNVFGRIQITQKVDEIVERQAVSPNLFECGVCGLKLTGSAALRIAGVGDHYSRRTTHTPAEYYGMYDEDDVDAIVEERLRDCSQQEYDNE